MSNSKYNIIKRLVSRAWIALSCMLVLFLASCGDKEEPKPVPETGTVTDIDGNVYKTVKIGNKWWMAENLKVTKYRNGTAIPNMVSADDWQGKTSGALCLYDPNPNSSPPGLLYNGYVLNDTSGIAPAGWHIPSDEEWKQMEQHLGMSVAEADKAGWRGTIQGDKLKPEGPNGWTRYANVWGTNESGFTALAGSCRLHDGRWGDPGLFATGFWWTATGHGDNTYIYRYLDYKNSAVFRSYTSSNYGFSIRCVKD